MKWNTQSWRYKMSTCKERNATQRMEMLWWLGACFCAFEMIMKVWSYKVWILQVQPPSHNFQSPIRASKWSSDKSMQSDNGLGSRWNGCCGANESTNRDNHHEQWRVGTTTTTMMSESTCSNNAKWHVEERGPLIGSRVSVDMEWE